MALPAAREPGREPIIIIEVDQDRCSLSYGVAPCTAAIGVTGERKCFNGLGSCQDTDNLTLGDPLTLRFVPPSSSLPRTLTLIPSLISVETDPAEINIDGAAKEMSPLGRRASAKITLQDHPHRDLLVDPYLTERDYDPLERGTFWSKWLSRNPFYEGRALRVREGYIGQALNDMTVRHYLIDRIDGPSAGVVTITAKDPLKKLDDGRAQAPAPSSGTVASNFADDAATFDLAPTGIGATYPASGIARIGGELFSYTRASDTVTFVDRGLRGTVAAAHTAGDSVQEVLVYDGEPIVDVLYELMVDYAGLDPAFIPLTDWQAQVDEWLPGFEVSTWITQPTGVNQLLSEIIDQSLLFFWWDEVEQEIRLQVLRPYDPVFDGSLTTLNDDQHLIADSIAIERRPEERLTQIWLYYEQINPTLELSLPSNFQRRTVIKNDDAEVAEQYGSRRVRQIFARWLTGANANEVLVIASRKLSAYSNTPFVVDFATDAKDMLGIGAVAQIRHDGIVDLTGMPDARNIQVTHVRPSRPGHLIEYRARPAVDVSSLGIRFGFIMANDAPDYEDASESQLLRGAWIAPDDSPVEFDDGGLPFLIL